MSTVTKDTIEQAKKLEAASREFLSSMRQYHPKDVLAICGSDLHLSDLTPIYRSNEPCWYSAQARILKQLGMVQEHYQNAPLIIAGDIFDRWKPSPRLIHLAMEFMPKVYAVPGQHDLPYHNIEKISHTGFGCLMQSGHIELIPNQGMTLTCANNNQVLSMYGAGWGQKIHPLTTRTRRTGTNLAVVHAYCWSGKHKYPGAVKESSSAAFQKQLANYDAAVFGDNHKHFIRNRNKNRKVALVNSGHMQRRHSDDVLEPSVSLLLTGGEWVRLPLMTALDKYVEAGSVYEDIDAPTQRALAMFMDIADEAESFETAVADSFKRYIEQNHTPHRTRQILMELFHDI